MLETLFHAADLLLAALIALILVALVLTRRVGRFELALFAAGMLLGAVWEFTFHFNGPLYRPEDPLFVHTSEWPLPPILQPAVHCLWDGGLFLVGVWWVRRLTPAPHFARFRWGELLVLGVWGVGSALLVEVVGSVSWYYVPRPWNPALFTLNDAPITLLPIATWAVAMLVFYAVALWLRPRILPQAEG